MCASAQAMPRPITEAEKAACEAVADHLARGSASEVEARIGPNAGAHWELRTAEESFASHGAVFHVVFPSGIDDFITFDMRQDGGKWRINAIHCLAEAVQWRTAALGCPISADSRGRLSSIGAALIMVIVVRRRRKWPWIAAAAIAVIAIIAIVRPKARLAALRNPPPAPTSPFAELLPLRRAMAAGASLPQIGQLTGDARSIALVWKAQRDFGRLPSEDVEKEILALETDSPMRTLLHARVLSQEGRDAGALQQYAALRNVQPQSDALWWEEETVSPRETATEPIHRAVQMGTRDADAYYVLSLEQFIRNKQSEAIAVFHEAFGMKPISRANVVSSGILSVLPRELSSSALVNIGDPDEPKTKDAALSESPMRVPAGTRATATGSFLRLAINGARLDIPFGARIAPAGTEALSGEEMDRQEADDAVQRATSLTESALASGAVQHTIENAIDALAMQNRWGDILRLTDGIGPQTENASPDLLVSRVRALVRTKRFAPARELATSLAAQRVIDRTHHPSIIAELGDLLAEAGAYDEALETYRKVKAIKNAPDMTPRMTQVGLRKTLAMANETAHTTHFEIHSMPDVGAGIPQKFGEQLERHLATLLQRFHLDHFKTVRVNVLRWDDWRWQVTGSDYVVGFYDGDLTIPWGTLGFGLGAASVMTHELTHAVVAQASNDNAPRWFQEGIAQRMETDPQPRVVKEKIAVALLDPMMQGSGDPDDMGNAYAESLRVIEYLEVRYGLRSIDTMIAAYRDGASNEDAIRKATGEASIADFDRSFRHWAWPNG